MENASVIQLPQKKFFRGRAHCNPLSHNDSFQYPLKPEEMEWKTLYPQIPNPVVEIADVGCGFGGLTMALAQLYPTQLTLAIEIRACVCEFVDRKIEALRSQHEDGQYQNVALLRTNAMKYLPHYFKKGQLKKMFFCFPDPQFKAKKFKRRIVSTSLLTEYAFFLTPGGILYTITDVEALYEWHVAKCDAHPCFERLSDEEMEKDACIVAMRTETEESKKVTRNGGKMFVAVYRRLPDDAIAAMPFFQ